MGDTQGSIFVNGEASDPIQRSEYWVRYLGLALGGPFQKINTIRCQIIGTNHVRVLQEVAF